MDIVKAVRNWVRKNYQTDSHLLRAEYWLKKLNPGADEAMIVAVISHDIERAFPEGRKPPCDELTVSWSNKKYLLWHGRRSAKFIGEFLKKMGANQDFIKSVKRLVTYHELGGDINEDFIKDADSISVLENNIPGFIAWAHKSGRNTRIKEKFDYMYNRISGKKAKDLATPFYKKALEELKAI